MLCRVHFSFDCNKSITKVSKTSPKKENITRSQQELEVKPSKLLGERENARNQVAVGFGFASIWFRDWREFSRSITERSR